VEEGLTTMDIITHWNRDRAGGHHPSHGISVPGCWDDDLQTINGRRFAKRKAMRRLRREHARITREALRQYEEDIAAQEEEELNAYYAENWYDVSRCLTV